MSRQLRLLFTSRLGLGLLGLLVLMSVLSGGIYQRLVLRELPVAVVDLDGSRLSRLVTTSLDATPELALSSAAGASLDDVRGRLERGEISAWVLIPEGFSANVKRGQKTQLLLATDMSNILVGKTVRSAASRVVATLNVGTEIAVLKKLGVGRSSVAARAYPIVVEDNQLFNPSTNYAEYLVPMVLFFLLHIYATVLWGGTWLEANSSWGTRCGQIVVTGVWCLGLGALEWWALPLSQVTVASAWWLGLASIAAYLVAQAGFVMVVSTALGKSAFGFQVVLFFSMLGLMLSGVTWPTYSFPPALAAVAEWLPFTHLARLLRMTIHFEATPADLASSLRALAILAAVFGAVGLALEALVQAWSQLRAPGASHEVAR